MKKKRVELPPPVPTTSSSSDPAGFIKNMAVSFIVKDRRPRAENRRQEDKRNDVRTTDTRGRRFLLGFGYFFLPKKLKRFSRSLSLPSLLRMVTPPVSVGCGVRGGMVIARVRGGGGGERSPPLTPTPPPGGMEEWIACIQELISA